jgi:FkbM family methyltransferase
MNFKNLIRNINNGYFIQIGAYDGVSNDEFGLKDKLFYEDSHTAILIEPVPDFFEKLVENYNVAKSKIFFENVAISDKKEIKKIQLNGQDTSFVRSFDKDTISIDVICETFTHLISKYNIKKIDALVIDVEGYELVLIKSILETKIPIEIIRYEFVHLNGDDKEKLDMILIENGYDIYQDETSYADKIAKINNK